MPSFNSETGNAKSALRRQAKLRRTEVAASLGENFARAAAEKFFSAIDARTGDVVASYWAIADEADPRVIEGQLHTKGIALALPAMKGEALVFRRWRPGDELAEGKFGTREPRASSPSVTPSVVIVPLLAFDAQGHRLGYGKGYYDRTLRALRARGRVLAVGLAYAAQRVASLPSENVDERLDWVITETGAIDFRSVR